tara:strand:- start:497 stop:715 length:219 start_codon:yes stop_codon:yes gene_type:complete
MRRKSTAKKDSLAHQRIDAHEKLCHIMQRETNKKIQELHSDVHRLERIMIGASGFLISSMLGLIVALFIKVF